MKQKSFLSKSFLAAIVFSFGFAVILSSSVVPAQVLAQGNTNGQTNIQSPAQDSNSDGTSGLVPCGNFADDPCTLVDLFNLFIVATNYLIGLAGVVAVLAILFAGCNMVLGNGNIEAVTHAKKNMLNAAIGLIIVIAAFGFINFFLHRGTGLVNTNVTDILRNPFKYIDEANQGPSSQTNEQTNTP